MIASVCRHADVDPVDDRYPYAEERDRLHRLAEFLSADPVMPPTVILDSGNGIQPLWAVVREPLTPEIIARVECENREVEVAVGAAGTHNIDRLLRLPGTLNFPNTKKLKSGRGVTHARVLHSASVSYSIEEAARLGKHLAQQLSKTGLVRSSPIRRRNTHKIRERRATAPRTRPLPHRDAEGRRGATCGQVVRGNVRDAPC